MNTPVELAGRGRDGAAMNTTGASGKRASRLFLDESETGLAHRDNDIELAAVVLPLEEVAQRHLIVRVSGSAPRRWTRCSSRFLRGPAAQDPLEVAIDARRNRRVLAQRREHENALLATSPAPAATRSAPGAGSTTTIASRRLIAQAMRRIKSAAAARLETPSALRCQTPARRGRLPCRSSAG